MARKSSIRYFESRSGYYTQFRGRQIRLADGPDDYPHGETYQRALAAFTELLQVDAAPQADQRNTVRVLVDLYGQKLEANGQTKSLTLLIENCSSAVKEFGDLTVRELKPYHVQKWLDGCDTWGGTTRKMALRTLLSALNWSVTTGLITAHPIKPRSVEVRNERRSRGAETYIDPATWNRFITHVERKNVRFAEMLKVMYWTGCRPAEAYHFERRYWDATARAMVFPGHPREDEFCWKMARKTGKARRVYVPDGLVPMIEARMREHPKGAIFRSRRNDYWIDPGVGTNMRWYSRELGIDPAVTAYGLRHSYATDFILAGGSTKVLADLIGTGVDMIDRHYSHLEVDPGRLRLMAAAAMAGRSAPAAAEELEAGVVD